MVQQHRSVLHLMHFSQKRHASAHCWQRQWLLPVCYFSSSFLQSFTTHSFMLPLLPCSYLLWWSSKESLLKDSRVSCKWETFKWWLLTRVMRKKETTSFFLKEMGFTSLTWWACCPTTHKAKLTLRWKIITIQQNKPTPITAKQKIQKDVEKQKIFIQNEEEK